MSKIKEKMNKSVCLSSCCKPWSLHCKDVSAMAVADQNSSDFDKNTPIKLTSFLHTEKEEISILGNQQKIIRGTDWSKKKSMNLKYILFNKTKKPFFFNKTNKSYTQLLNITSSYVQF